MTEIENLTLKEFIKENLKKGYIQPLQLLVGYLVLFIPKKTESCEYILIIGS